ncbi:KdsC family phosphatase [Nafulsella turpanensis]|uniref:KdsC family phosphatase n=1 Tax=Nafulsella turpanensis TaxID=1265690 RepID=UPI00034595B4|nr:HAD hydrolase family protein [Nafulsella turpanensis]
MESILEAYTSTQIDKARKVKMIICDVDGVLTNGGIIYDNAGTELKIFNVKDGQVMKMLRHSGLRVGAITGRSSEVVRLRMEEMGMDFHYHGIKDKYQQYQEIKKEWELQDEEISYLGDDIIDIPVLKQCGFAITPQDAKPYVKAYAHLVTEARGGEGVFREAADLILAAQGKFEQAMWQYLENYQEKS